MSKNNGTTEKWDRRFLELANHIATWSKDPSTKVGAVIVRSDRTVAAIGYNGFPRGVLDHAERYADRDQKYPMVVHAETNAIINSRESLEGCTLYVTPIPPCSTCTGLIIQRGITRIVIEQKKDPEKWKKEFEIARTMLQEAGVSVVMIQEPRQRKTNDNTDTVSIDTPSKDVA